MFATAYRLVVVRNRRIVQLDVRAAQRDESAVLDAQVVRRRAILDDQRVR